MLINLNGRLVTKEKAVVSVFDHGLLYGDGVFEGIRAYGGRVFKLREHITRLYDSARVILLKMPFGPEKMTTEVIRTLAANHLRDAYVRLVVTRGEGDLGLAPEKCKKGSTFFIIADKIVLYPDKFYRNGLSLVTVPTRRNVVEALSPKIKSLNYLNNIMAKIEASRQGALEAIMLTSDGYVAECTGDNLFAVRKGRLLTPPAYQGALEGVTRQVVLDLAQRMGQKAAEEPLTRYDLYTAEEVFLTGTAAELVPVAEVDGRKIGPGRPGPVTLKLLASFRKLTQTEGLRIS